ncbi:hypothetical protein [Candidatus Vampirococcus lugosii]|uniref:Uncharacterized protein n=1 Tax=Candidatus Vampirococcus lugosii TaxID=2789015 RepID=A0ABS5QLP9_9BACT|nr:hypothetical protein [Candidatus Vampirococcus lugosii]MBS8121703.1 hypothetical protein [Candidatus Vampirococcus lugosii]
MKIKIKFILSLILISPMFSNSFSLKEYYEDETKDYDQDSLLEDHNESSFLGNIYTNSHNLVRETKLKSEKDSFSYVVDYLSDMYSCSVSEDDIYNIYSVSNPSFVYIQSGMDPDSQISTDKDDFIESCKNVVRCFGDNNVDAIEGYTQSTRNLCTSKVNSIVNSSQDNISKNESIKYDNSGSDMFMNGSLENSPFDLLVDIKNIGDTLFEDNEEPEEINFYETDSGGNSDGSSGGDQTLLNKTLLTQNLGNKTGLNSGLLTTNLLNSNLLALNSLNGDGENQIPNDSVSNGLINNFVCNENIDIVNPEQIYEQTNKDINQNLEDISNAHDDLVSQLTQNVPSNDIDFASDGSAQALDNFLGNQFEEQGYAITNPGGGNGTGDLTGTSPSPIDGIDHNSFVSKIGGMGLTDCINAGDKDSIFWIRVCMVYTETTGIVDQKTIMASEEAVDEINNVLLNLKRTGSIMKHKKTDEMREIGLQDIEFSKIFAFDLVLKTKPTFPGDGKYKEEARIAVIEEKNKEFEKKILKLSESPDLKSEKNKYLVRANPARMEGETRAGGDTSNRQGNIDYLSSSQEDMKLDHEKVSSNENESSMYEYMDIFHGFIEFNHDYWEQKNTTLHSIEDISRGFKERVVSGGG